MASPPALSPQQSAVPLVRRPQAKSQPALIWVKRPESGVASPPVLLPQQSAVAANVSRLRTRPMMHDLRRKLLRGMSANTNKATPAPSLYLEGRSGGDLDPVCRALIGQTAALSPSAILRLKQEWEME